MSVILLVNYLNLSFVEEYRLLQSVDDLKDQSYFLSQIDGSFLDRIVFPVGDLLKSDVRELAAKHFERLARKKSSTGICFIGPRHFSQFIDNYLPPLPGPIFDLDDNKNVGQHKGIHNYTVGQRIVVEDKMNVKKKAYYVAYKNMESNAIFVVSDTKHPALYYDEFEIETPHWICEQIGDKLEGSDIVLDDNFDFKFQSKYKQTPLVHLRREYDRINNKPRYWVKTKYHFRAVVAGQVSSFNYKIFFN